MGNIKIIIIVAFVTSFLSVACVNGSGQDSNMLKVTAETPKHHTPDGFQNYPVIQTTAPKGMFFIMRRLWASIFLPDIPDGHALPQTEALKLLKESQGASVTWLGQASFIIKISGKTILTDPFLTEFASPLSWAGPRRYVPPGIPLKKLPSIDIVIVSHNHYDHLDDETIKALPNKDTIQVIVPLGLKAFFLERGFLNVTELDWSEQISIDNLTFIALPAVHDSGRSTSDHNKTLWASWVIMSPKEKVYFIGDTGYSDTIFKQIGNQYGPFDYAIIPIGAYEPRKLMWMSHITPEEAVTVGKEVRANTLIASHWGTINLSDEPQWEPPNRFRKAGLDNGFIEESLMVMKIGETQPILLLKTR